MGLKSRLFRGDRALEACLLQDAAHVKEGARGDHVAKIQTAVSVLGERLIQSREISLLLYGPSTAAAVLAYKTKHKIINKSYQTQADNIVGKMTIAALDQGMLAIENSVPPDERWKFLGSTTRSVSDRRRP